MILVKEKVFGGKRPRPESSIMFGSNTAFIQIYSMNLVRKWTDLCRMKYDRFVKEMAIPAGYSKFNRYSISLGVVDDCEIILFVEDKKPLTIRIVDNKRDIVDDYDLDTEMELLRLHCWEKL